ncbi:phage holin family protein [Ancylobacter oerskovii]|uniref:Phage holin family protein n=1 Tax=Ancylobacter oerskovii TaxID=459519 RepID=A0ABW4YUL1_9HYPH|nr:phage holin family protein [Ancylobacter oerskovii]MBS7544457.1 phage holin family protein [Ancylobacter oerskovii]
MLKLLFGLVGAEVNFALRRAATTGLLLLLGALLLCGALFALMAALFIALAEAYDPLVAALLIAALALLAGIVLLIVAYARLKAPARTPGLPLAGLRAAANRPVDPLAPPPRPPFAAQTVVGIAAVAAIVGLILGRRI